MRASAGSQRRWLASMAASRRSALNVSASSSPCARRRRATARSNCVVAWSHSDSPMYRSNSFTHTRLDARLTGKRAVDPRRGPVERAADAQVLRCPTTGPPGDLLEQVLLQELGHGLRGGRLGVGALLLRHRAIALLLRLAFRGNGNALRSHRLVACRCCGPFRVRGPIALLHGHALGGRRTVALLHRRGFGPAGANRLPRADHNAPTHTTKTAATHRPSNT